MENNDKTKIAVILSMYDGLQFISEQVDSILLQNIPIDVDLKLYIRNDQEVSSDETLDYLSKIKHNPRIAILPNYGKNLGVQNSFLELLKCVKADYYFFSDQDDIWNKNKVSSFLKSFNLMEDSANLPTLLYSDVELIDASGKIMNVEFSEIVRNRSQNGFEHRIFYDNVTGAAMAINRKLRDLIVRVNMESFSSVPMHDSAIAQLASLSGQIGFLPEKLICYRQHEKNTLGIKSKHLFKFGITNLNKKIHQHASHLKQAELMISILDENEIVISNKKFISMIGNSKKQSFLKKIKNGYLLSKYAEGFFNKIVVVIVKMIN